MFPQKGESYDITVAPGQSKMILMRTDAEGYSLSMSLTTSVVMGGKKLKELTKQDGKKVSRTDTDTGEEREIYCYTYKHAGGICYLYENESEKYTLDEEVQFKLTGLQIENKPNEDTVEFKIGPGQSKFIKLVSIADTWKIG